MVGNKISDKIFSTVVSIISFILMAVCVVCIIINTKKEPQPGDTGQDGKSAYEIAVANGYKGTEQEWLQSLVGSRGESGISVVDVKLNENGDLVITLSNGEVISCGGHSDQCVHEYSDWSIISEASCENLGIRTRACKKCDYKDYEIIDKEEHKYIEKIVSPTCVSEGYTEKTCEKCGKVVKENIVEKIEHDYEDFIIEPTCTKDGYTEHICKNCGKLYADNTVAHLEHNYEFLYEVSSTCKEHKVLKQCSICNNAQLFDEKIVAEHNYVNNVCTVCGKSLLTAEESFEFTLLEDNTYEVKLKKIENIPNTIVIPETYNDVAVTVIGDGAFKDLKEIVSISLPNTITKIGRNAFSGCENLVTINISEGVKEIGNSAFKNCYNLKNIELPSTIEKIDTLAFYNCKSIKVFVLSQNLKSIGEFAFFECSNLTYVELYNNVETIGNGAFTNCVNLVSINIPASVINMGEYVFANCPKLTIYCAFTSAPSTWSVNWNADECLVKWE